MKYAVVFTLFAACLGLLVVTRGGWAFALLWPATSFLFLALAYAVARPALLGKRTDGRLAWWAWLLFAPVLLLLWALWELQTRLSREPACHEVAPGIWLGRRPRRNEVSAGIALVVDLTAEFPVARGLREGRDYFLLATLDGVAPQEAAFRAAVERIVSSQLPVLIHCALGHGRSAALAGAVLLARGLSRDAQEAEARLRKLRPGVRLNTEQRRLLRKMESVRRDEARRDSANRGEMDSGE